MKPQEKKYEVLVGKKTLTIATGILAEQAGGAATVSLGDSQIFTAATMSDNINENANFFPLTVNYEERMYAGGRIPGSFFRREGRPGEKATLIARLTDRPIRPLFPKDMKNPVQIIAYAFSSDAVNPLDILVVNATSVAITISDIAWDGPIGAVRVGRIDGEFVINPTYEELEYSDLDLVMAASRDAVLMVESFSDEVSEETIVNAINYGHQSIQPFIDVQEQMAKEIGKEKRAYPSFEVSDDFKAKVKSRAIAPLKEILVKELPKAEMKKAISDLKAEIADEIASVDESLVNDAKEAFQSVYKEAVRDRILEEGKRPDGRDYTTVRDIWCEVEPK